MQSFSARKLALAEGQLRSATSNMAKTDLETAASRAFLAAENAAVAAIAKCGIRVRPIHTEVRTLFEDLCDKGVIPEKFRSLLTGAYAFRLRADYGRRFHGGQTVPDLTQAAVRDIIDRVAELIDIVTKMPAIRRTRRIREKRSHPSRQASGKI